MANTRFGIVNGLLDATLANGDGTAPARSEVSPYVMERVQIPDRRAIAVVGAANQDSGFAWEWTWDFGSARAFTMAAALNVVHDGGVAFVKVGKYAAYASAKTEAASLTRNGPDWGASFASVSGQYWYFNFVGTGLVSVGALFLSSVTDLGVIGLPGFESSPFRVRTEQPQDDGSIVLSDTGRVGHEFNMEFWAKDTTELAKYEALIQNPGSVILIDDRGRTFEVVITGGKLPIRREHSRYPVTLSMMRMP